MNRAKRGVKDSEGILNPKLHKSNEVRIIKHNGAKQVIIAGNKDTISFNKYLRKWVVNGKSFDANRFYIRINKRIDLDSELKALTTLDLLKKKLNKHFNNIERLRYLTGDDKLLKTNRILKAKVTIRKYLNILRGDTNFKLIRREADIFLGYKGRYVTAQKVVVL